MRRAEEIQEDRDALDADPGWEARVADGDLAMAALVVPTSPERIAQLRRMDYRTEYLLTPEWRERRAWLLAATGYRCSRCGMYSKVLDVHHRTYERLGDEAPQDIVALCRRCHQDEHARVDR